LPTTRALLKPVQRRIIVIVVLAATIAGVAAVLAFDRGSPQPARPTVTEGDDANVMRALQRPKLVQKAP
jgi:Flp pilus assembly protein CpaB